MAPSSRRPRTAARSTSCAHLQGMSHYPSPMRRLPQNPGHASERSQGVLLHPTPAPPRFNVGQHMWIASTLQRGSGLPCAAGEDGEGNAEQSHSQRDQSAPVTGRGKEHDERGINQQRKKRQNGITDRAKGPTQFRLAESKDPE